MRVIGRDGLVVKEDLGACEGVVRHNEMLMELRQDYDTLEVWVREKYVGLDTLAELTLMWGDERNLIKGSTSDKQMLKLVEEMGELASGLAKKNPEVVKDSIGDCLVVLSMISAQEGLALSECWLSAWKDIKDRKGRMVDGVFVKQEDLANGVAKSSAVEQEDLQAEQVGTAEVGATHGAEQSE